MIPEGAERTDSQYQLQSQRFEPCEKIGFLVNVAPLLAVPDISSEYVRANALSRSAFETSLGLAFTGLGLARSTAGECASGKGGQS
jgi:hypothetical protein